ncbi:MAG: DUF4258 domain-containing protein [Ktedonobacterales bacterium]
MTAWYPLLCGRTTSVTLRELQDAVRAGYTRVGAHAIREAATDGHLIDEIWDAVLSDSTEIIEEYPTDPRGSSYLVYCEVHGQPEHVVVAYPSVLAAQRLRYPALVFMITCYCPTEPKYRSRWSVDYKRRQS